MKAQFDMAYAAFLCIERCNCADTFSGRVVIGSWYGEKTAQIVGGTFHRSRVRLISSQVSTIFAQVTGCWDKSRRFELRGRR
jgi:hypothetical protein